MKYVLALVAALVIAAPSFAQLPVELAKDQQALLKSKDPQLAANKKVVFDFWRVILQARHLDKAADYLAEDYIQHNPMVPTGLKGFMDFFEPISTRGTVKPTVDNLVSIVAEGDLVVLATRSTQQDSNGESYTTTWFDMFRVNDGKITEHWDYGTK